MFHPYRGRWDGQLTVSNTQEAVSLRVKARGHVMYKPVQCPSWSETILPSDHTMLSKVVPGIGKNWEHPLRGARPKKSTCSMCRIMGQMPIVSVLAQV